MTTSRQTELNRFPFFGYDLPEGFSTGRVSLTLTDGKTTGRVDMDVNGIGSAYGAYPVRSVSTGKSAPQSVPTRPAGVQDSLEISPAAKMLDQLSQNGDLRAERLARIKAEIEAGTYDTDAKLEAALSKMFSKLGIDIEDQPPRGK